MIHNGMIVDADPYFIIEPKSRLITNQYSGTINIIQFDHNSERFTFSLPRYIEGHDMSKCNVTQIHYSNIDASTSEQNSGVYLVDDVKIDETDDSLITLSWLISQSCTQKVGKLEFSIKFACVNNDEQLDYAWNTAVFTGITVTRGMNNTDETIEINPDIYLQVIARCNDMESKIEPLVINGVSGDVAKRMIENSESSVIDIVGTLNLDHVGITFPDRCTIISSTGNGVIYNPYEGQTEYADVIIGNNSTVKGITFKSSATYGYPAATFKIKNNCSFEDCTFEGDTDDSSIYETGHNNTFIGCDMGYFDLKYNDSELTNTYINCTGHMGTDVSSPEELNKLKFIKAMNPEAVVYDWSTDSEVEPLYGGSNENIEGLTNQVTAQGNEIDKLAEDNVIVKKIVDSHEERLDNIETFVNKMPIVSSVDEMTDTSMQYVLESTGTIWEYGETTIDDTDKNLFVKEEVALNQNPDGTTRDGHFSTGFIPADVNAVEDLKFLVTVNGAVLQDGYPLIYKIQHYKADLTTVGGQMYMNGFQSPNTSEWYLGTNQTGTDHNGGLGTNYFQIAYFKLLIDVTDNSNVITMDDVPDLVITTNEPKIRVESGWYDTGIVDEGGTVNLGDINTRINKNTNDIKNLDDRLEIVENAVNEGSDIPLIPDYWKAEVDSKEATIKELQNEGGADAFQFIWVSDIHGSSDYTKHIGAVARYAMDKYNIPIFVCSGDIMSQSSHTTESAVWDEYERMNTILSPIKPDEMLAVKGNHDGSWGEAVNGVYYLRNIGTKAVYNAIYRKGAKDRTKVYGKDGTYYYVDIHGMRVFMLNAHTDGDGSNDANGYANYNSQKVNVCGQEQLEWLCDSLSSMEEGMTAIIVAHPPLYNADESVKIQDRNLLIGIIEAFNNKTSYSGNVTVTNDYWGKNVSDTTYKNISVSVNFASAKGKILAYFHGHIHRDIDGNNPQYSIPNIHITTAGGDIRDTNAVERIIGTATETAMDIVIVNKDKISLVRLGAGEDREVTI